MSQRILNQILLDTVKSVVNGGCPKKIAIQNFVFQLEHDLGADMLKALEFGDRLNKTWDSVVKELKDKNLI